MPALAKLYFGWRAYFKTAWQPPTPAPPQDLLDKLQHDGITLLAARFDPEQVLCILAATDQLSPHQIAHRLKGRWDHALRARPSDFTGFKRHFLLRSLGQNTRDVVRLYIQGQVDASDLADPLYRERMKTLRFHQDGDAKLKTSHSAIYDLFLHVILVTADRYCMGSSEAKTVFAALRDGMLEVGADPYEASMMPDHAHLMARWPAAMSAAELMEAIKQASGRLLMRSAYWSDGGYMGTVGPYRLQVAIERNRRGGWASPQGL